MTYKKVRVNITVDKVLLEKAKTKLSLFGGKLSTLFNAYLADFVESMEKNYSDDKRILLKKLEALEARIDKLENAQRK
jgi:hypothetical protein